jgi:VIT1/CCC1 family predicted Fe2+/Mn2+ transporter
MGDFSTDNLDPDTKRELIRLQANELTEYTIYQELEKVTRDENNRKVLEEVLQDELNHWNTLEGLTKSRVQPNGFRVARYRFLARWLGLSFALKLMERHNNFTKGTYRHLSKRVPGVALMLRNMDVHEHQVLARLKEEPVEYAGAMVLGLNDAIVEFTGTLAGLTLAIQNAPLIGLSVLVMGVAASLSMAASGYQSWKEDGEKGTSKNPVKGALYTGLAYIATVLVLISPYFFNSNVFVALATTVSFSVLIILIYTFYISTAKDLDFKKRFLEMTLISLSIAAVSFCAGWVIKHTLGIAG